MFWIFKNTSVDAVLANFNKTIDDLKSIEATHEQEAQTKHARAKALTAEAQNHGTEALRASTIAGKISALISADK